MLILQATLSDSIYVFDDKENEIMEIRLLSTTPQTARIGLNAPKEYKIYRGKLLKKIKNENINGNK